MTETRGDKNREREGETRGRLQRNDNLWKFIHQSMGFFFRPSSIPGFLQVREKGRISSLLPDSLPPLYFSSPFAGAGRFSRGGKTGKRRRGRKNDAIDDGHDAEEEVDGQLYSVCVVVHVIMIYSRLLNFGTYGHFLSSNSTSWP